MADELPFALDRGLDDLRIRGEREPLMFITPGILNSSKILSRRQNPTRLPYSCQHQFGMSGIGEPPAGGVSTVRGIGCVASHSSTLTIIHTAMRAPSGSLSGLRS